MIPNTEEIRVYCIAYGCEWTSETLRDSYEAIIATWNEAGFPPERLGAKAPGIKKNWGTFNRTHKRLEETKFEGVEHLSLAHLAAPNEHYPTVKHLYPDRDWLVYAAISVKYQRMILGWIPALLGGPALSFIDLFKQIVETTNPRYGFCYQKKVNPPSFSEMPDDSASREVRTNMQEWQSWASGQTESSLLIGVYPHNYLSDAQVNAPFGRSGQSIREWIEADPASRGSLAPFTDFLTEWTPPVENIPMLREQLFRAGRLFYYRFFRKSDYDRVIWRGKVYDRMEFAMIDKKWEPTHELVDYPPEPFYRCDILAPWEAPEPVPEIFRADFYRSHCKELNGGMALD